MNLLVLSCLAILSFPSVLAQDSCTITQDTLSNLASIKANCSDIIVGDLTVPAGETLDLTSLPDYTTVTFRGNVSFGYEEWEGPLISVSGSYITVKGESGHVLDGQGYRWWDGIGGNGGKTKPKFFFARNLNHSLLEGLYVLNSPKNCFSVNTDQNVTLIGITLDNRDGDVENGGHNTDAFDVGDSDGVYISNCTVYNQDDCLAINSGSNIYFTNNFCSGGHGISIGSVGNRTNNDVNNVYISDCEIISNTNGVRIKTVYNATGSVNNVTYRNIYLSNITEYGIVFRSDYKNSGPTGVPTGGVPITNIVLSNIAGSVHPKGTNVYVLVESASNWSWTNINVTGGLVYKTCVGMPEDSGYTCASTSNSSNSSISSVTMILAATFILLICQPSK